MQYATTMVYQYLIIILNYRHKDHIMQHNCITTIHTLRLRQNRCHFADIICKCIFLNENVWISINISPKFVPKGLINNIPALVQIMAWHQPGDKPLSEPMMVSLLMHIYVTRPQWVKQLCAREVRRVVTHCLLCYWWVHHLTVITHYISVPGK